MIDVITNLDNKFNISNDINTVKKNSWINLVNPNINIIEEISKKTNIDYNLLLSSIDNEETAHMDNENNTNLIVVDIPYLENGYYVTIPFSILYNSDYIVTICTKETNIPKYINTLFKIETNKHIRLTIQILYSISNQYIKSLRKIDESINKTEEELICHMKNKDILKLMNINKSLVHFSTSLNANKMLLNKIDKIDDFKKYEEDLDLLDDLMIEHNQATEMCSIYRDILTGSMESFNSMISNNMNDSMQRLAIITLALSFPTLIASIFGMNLELPFTQSKYSVYYVVGFSFLLSLIGGFLIYKITNRRKK